MRSNPFRLATVVFLSLCVWTAVNVPSHGQQSAPLPFPAGAWRAIAHGKPAEAEALARARPADDPAALAVIAHLAIEKGKYSEAIAALRPAARRAPLSDAALSLALLQKRLGDTAAASQALTVLFRQSEGDPASLLRAGRAAAALGRAREANSLFRSAAAAGPDPAIETAWGMLFLEKYNRAEAVKSFQQALAQDPNWAPALAGLARALSRRRSAGRRGRRGQGARDRSAAGRRGAPAGRARARQHPLRRRAHQDRARPRAEPLPSRRARAGGRHHLRPRRPCRLRRGSEAGARDQPVLRRDLPRGRGARRAELPLRRCGGARAGSGSARSDQRPRARRSGHAPDAHGRRAAGAPGARPRVRASTRTTSSPTTSWRSSTRSTSSSRSARGTSS